jgi:glycosyltransferase involved in cell wall biosynthesis
MNKGFSILMSVYHKENEAHLAASIQSVMHQTMKPSRIVIVKDGRLTEPLDRLLNSRLKEYPDLFTVVGYESNKGLGEALNFGLKYVDTEFVFRMDADDLSVPDRCEKQWEFLQANKEVDVLGTNTLEFIDDPAKPIRIKKVPEKHEDIKRMAKMKNPMNHMTVAFKTSQVREAGGYRHAPFFEDYDLWVRMLILGKQFHNLQENLVLARTGNDMVGKRHGIKYCGFEIRHFTAMKDLGFLSLTGFLKAVALRVPMRLLPKAVLAMFYNFALRKKYGR